MAKEFETKVLDIDVHIIVEKLTALGAKRYSELFMRRWIFDISRSRDEWIRLRTDGKKSTITYKMKTGTGISETEEIEIEVSDFDKAHEILSKLQFKDILYQESRRILFKLKGMEFTIDSWPQIPTYLEIESTSEEKVRKGLKMLGLEGKDSGNIGVNDIYKKYGIILPDHKEIRF